MQSTSRWDLCVLLREFLFHCPCIQCYVPCVVHVYFLHTSNLAETF